MTTDTQCSKILKELKNNPDGVENYKFPRWGILKYSSRITELRKEGHEVVAERQYVNGRATGVWLYRLAGKETRLQPGYKPMAATILDQPQKRFSLFGRIYDR